MEEQPGRHPKFCDRFGYRFSLYITQRLTTAKRKVLEDPELYPEHTRHALPDSDATRLDQKMRRRKVCEKLVLVPGKLDHATIVAYTVEDRRQSLRNYREVQYGFAIRSVPIFFPNINRLFSCPFRLR